MVTDKPVRLARANQSCFLLLLHQLVAAKAVGAAHLQDIDASRVIGKVDGSRANGGKRFYLLTHSIQEVLITLYCLSWKIFFLAY